MKTIIASLVLSLGLIVSTAATWTIHLWPDNACGCEVAGPYNGDSNPSWVAWASVDTYWDSLNPNEISSGVGESIFNAATRVYDTVLWTPGFTDPMVLESLGTVDSGWFYLSGPGPDYNGWFYSATLPLAGGEFWIDYDSSGTATGRLSSVKPSDFGKWAWDGSINPSWTAAKKGFAKGHNKQPLPTTK